MTSYKKFKTPFFSIEVADDKSPNKFIKLPTQLHRLVNRIEITEALKDACATTSINIIFSEGSREPFKTSGDQKTAGIYLLEGANDSDSLTNQIALIADLKFSGGAGSGGNIGITSINSAQASAAVAGARERSLGEAGGLDNISTGQLERDQISPRYLFNENNKIKVTWGYLEDELNKRQIVGTIKMFRFDFPSAGATKAQVIAYGSATTLNQLSATKGIKFSKQTAVGRDQINNTLITEDKNLTIQELITIVAGKLGMKTLISDSFPDSETEYVDVWPAGESAHEFLMRLAHEHRAIYKTVIDPSSGEEFLVFLHHKEYDQLSKFDPNLLVYRGEGSILKSISMKADFSNKVGTLNVGYNKEGNLVGKGDTHGKNQIVADDKQEIAMVDPTSDTKVGASFKNSSGGKTVGKVQYVPSADNEGKMQETSETREACNKDRTIVIEFTTLGYTRLHPRTVPISGLGRRYSGKYKIHTVTHTIDSTGYTCNCVATSPSLAGGGIAPLKVNNTSIKEETDKVEQKLFEPEQKSAAKTKSEQYFKIFGLA